LSISTEELKEKEVINILSGEKLGYADDFEIDTETGKVILGRNRFFGLFGREDNIVIPFSEIKLIGHDTILVERKHF
jgi:YlmC/YmxH family sporulation protein